MLLKNQSVVPYCFMYLLMTSAILLNTPDIFYLLILSKFFVP